MMTLAASNSAFAQFDAKMQVENPNVARLLTVAGQTVKTANSEDIETALGKHTTYFYPDTIRATSKHTHEVAVEMRHQKKVLLRQWWLVDCHQAAEPFVANIGIANFVTKQLYDETAPAAFSQFRSLKGDLSLNLDYQYAAIHGKRPYILAACQYIQHKNKNYPQL